MAVRVTISDIARELNTTPATVSRALQDHPRISDEMKRRVHATAERLNFKINKIASSLRSGRSHVIGVIIPSAQINFFGSVVHGIESMANELGYSVLIFQTNEMESYEMKGLETFLSAQVDGILVSISKETLHFDHFQKVKSKGVPIVFFDRHHDNLGISSVTIDDYKGAYLAVSHLIQQGYRNIAHISGPHNVQIFLDRIEGYKKALLDHHMEVKDEFLIEGNVSIETGRTAFRKLMALPNKPDAVFAVEDFTALGVIKEAKLLGLSIPDQLGIIGFANEQFDEHITPSLSSVDQQTVRMGKEAFRLIIDEIESKVEVMTPKNIKLEPIPYYRESSNKSR